MNRDEQDLKFTLKWVYVGLVGHGLWSLVQLFHFYFLAIVFEWQPLGNLVDLIQKTVMMAGVSPNRRISGLALEPSWLAAQVMTVYLPWVFASVLTGYHWSKRKWLAPISLVVCAGLILFTYSRSGILISAVALLLTFLFVGWGWMRQAWEWLLRPFHRNNPVKVHRVWNVGTRIALISVIFIGLAGGLYVLSRNKYFARVWESDKRNLTSYFVDIYAGPRLAFAWTGWTIFEQHPWTGVGLGATGFYFYQALPDWSRFNITEISQLLSPDNLTYPNNKNLYIRLLAETGIVGLWLFISFYLLLLGKVFTLLRSKRKELVFVGTASLLAWFAIVALGLSQDSLAMLNIWMPFGILVGMADVRA
jgi:O-antigen ligase